MNEASSTIAAAPGQVKRGQWSFTDMTGQKFTRLLVLEFRGNNRHHKRQWLCRCDCGKELVVLQAGLRNGSSKSCGCFSRDNAREAYIDLTGRRFYRLVVISLMERGKPYKWLCKCDCGESTIVSSAGLTSKKTGSCGCLQRESVIRKNTTHGLACTPEYPIWNDMKRRCYNPKTNNFHNYGGRGITVCDRWLESFENFYADMGPRPSRRHCIERINNNLGYSPENCKWATYREQARNTRANRLVTLNGETRPMIAWADEAGVCIAAMAGRLDRDWPDRLLLLPKQKNGTKMRLL